MYATSHKNPPKTPVTKGFTDGSQMVSKGLPDGFQNALFFRPPQRISRRLIHGVLVFISSGARKLPRVISSTIVSNAALGGFC
jgi:hypothetical protein